MGWYGNIPALSAPLRCEEVETVDAKCILRHGGAVELHPSSLFLGTPSPTCLRKMRRRKSQENRPQADRAPPYILNNTTPPFVMVN